MSKKRLVDLFAGAGGLTWGFYKNNFEIVKTVEFWKPATLTYNLNFKTEISPCDITLQETKEELSQLKDIDIVIGGFPCQGFSMAGKRSQNDERNKLYLHTIEVIIKLQPTVFVLENVKGILSYKESDGIKVTDKIEQIFTQNGYFVSYLLLDSSNFGVAQKRERVIFIGSKDKEKVQQTIELLKNTKQKMKTVKDAIADLEEISENKDFNHIFTKHSPEFIEKISLTPVGQSVMKNFKDAFRRLDYNKPSLTVKENHGGVHVHPKLNRVLTPRELARLQSFPDDFLFVGSKSDVLKQIGNAVPAKLSYEIAKIIRKVFFKESEQK
ncbi:DNA cytosine methyltransferase [Mycoplasma sp. 1012]